MLERVPEEFLKNPEAGVLVNRRKLVVAAVLKGNVVLINETHVSCKNRTATIQLLEWLEGTADELRIDSSYNQRWLDRNL